jgi:pilus assembly protein CpaF
MSWDVILPFLRDIEGLIRDREVSDIMVNGSDSVFVEKSGKMQEVPGVSLSEKTLQVAVRNIARALGYDISSENPLLDARLPDGSRVAAIFPPCSLGGTTLTIRKFHGGRYSLDELVRIGSLAPELLPRLPQAVESGQHILISGRTGAGKTTLLSALSACIPPEERIVVIEDTSEIQIDRKNVVRLEARREQPPAPAVTIRDLLRATLRLRPDRIILGEVRGGEAFEFLQALNTGHLGTLCTIHANSAPQAIARFATCVLLSDVELPYKAIRANIGDLLNLLVHIDLRHGRRLVTQVFAVAGYDAALDQYRLERIYEPD